MEIEIFRQEFSKVATLGKMYVEGDYFADTLEQVDKKFLKLQESKLIYSACDFEDCAIPCDTYELQLVWSKIDSRYLPEVQNVPFFPSVFIKGGYTWRDCYNSIIIGLWRERWQVMSHSNRYLDRLNARIRESLIIHKQPINLTISWQK